MEMVKQNAYLFKCVIIDNYGEDPTERIQPRKGVNLYIPTEISVNYKSHIILLTVQLLRDFGTPLNFTCTLYNHKLPTTRIWDHVIITKQIMDQQLHNFTYP